LILLGLSLT